MNTTLRAAVHLEKDSDMNLRCVKNDLWKTTGQGQTETTGTSLINFQDLRWVSTSLLHSRAYQYSTAKANVFSDSVLCLGKMGDNPVELWKKQIQWFWENKYFSGLNRIDGQLMEFEWKIFPGFTTVRILNQIQQMMVELQCESENFTGRIIFISMFNDIVWDTKGNDELCENNSKTIKKYAERFPCGHWSFLLRGSEKKWYGTFDCKTERMLQNFAGSGHPIFRCTSGLERGELRSKGGGMTSIHFSGSAQNIELLLQMVLSVNQLSIHGAVADVIEELPVGLKAPKKPAAPGQLDKVEILAQIPLAEVQANGERQGNLLQECEVEVGHFFFALPSIFMPRKTMPRDQEGTRIGGCLCFKIKPYLG